MTAKAGYGDMELFGGRKLPSGKTLVMGILNITNDSFYAASRVSGESGALARALSMAEAGADIIDVGAESTRPGSRGAKKETEADALIPVVRSIRRGLPDMPISVDTRHASVAALAIEAGADIINDVSGLELPDEAEAMASLTAGSGAAYVLMHTKGTPDVMQEAPEYGDLMPELRDFFERKIEWLVSHGVNRGRIITDPGIGFGKRVSDNLAILANVEKFFEFGRPVLIGASRKSFIGNVSGGAARNDPAERLEGTLAITSLCALAGVSIVRVHDVAANRRAVDMISEIARHRL
ncbi:MAG: dihydropteroate synthase [Synergistaceae bacterium]|jgi:dihydropteroate synthase|nr:dihydropteroate synthase [Synergistaceae bacterium]